MARPRKSERGAALLVVMVAVAVLTALAVDLAYDTRVSLRIAGNARDELRATYLARSGVALSRLVLSFQQDVDNALSSGAALGQPLPRPQLWKIVPLGSELAGNLFEEPAPASAPAPGAERPAPGAAVGPPPGGFETVIDDEGRKVSMNLDAEAVGGRLSGQVQALWQLICDPRWDALFDHEDENGQRYSRQDLMIHLRDWIDEKDEGSALAASFPTTCVMVTPPNRSPFEQGFSDENFPYDRGEDRYRTKNARMDSLGELHLVAGVTDAFMAAFADDMTVYLRVSDKRNVNTLDRAGLLINARIAADPQGQALLYDPDFADKLQKAVTERTLGGMLALTPMDFVQIVQALGVKVNLTAYQPSSTSNPFTDRSTVFKIRSAGRSGDVTKTVEAVVWFQAAQQGQAQQQVVTIPGQLRHWRED
jgi:general secretion pathway protein K